MCVVPCCHTHAFSLLLHSCSHAPLHFDVALTKPVQYLDIPTQPSKVYADKGWISWDHFLGVPGADLTKTVRSVRPKSNVTKLKGVQAQKQVYMRTAHNKRTYMYTCYVRMYAHARTVHTHTHARIERCLCMCCMYSCCVCMGGCVRTLAYP